MLRILFGAAFAAMLGVSGATLADPSGYGGYKDGPIYVPQTSWTGFYLGVGIGGGAINHDLTLSAPGGSAELNGIGGNGVLGTVEIGYDGQNGRLVGGVFFNYDFSNVSSSARILDSSVNADLNGLWSVGGRVGYLLNASTLAYALAAYTQADFSLPFGVKSNNFAGYSVGGGLETKLGANWFLKAEYRFIQLDTQTLFSAPPVKLTDSVDIQSARLVLSYKTDLFGRDYSPLK